VNPFLIELLGFSRSEMIGKTVGELSPFKDIEPNKVMLERLQKEGYVRYENLPLETTDGRHIPVEFISNVYQEGGRQVIQCNIRDMTAHKLAGDEFRRTNAELEGRVLERTAQLNATNIELEAFSNSVSHDLRAPLRATKGFVEKMQRDTGPAGSKINLDRLAAIHKELDRMENLIVDLLAFAHSGRLPVRKKDINLDVLVRDTLRDFDAETKARKIVWTVQPLPTVQADRGLLRLVLVNLMSNAVKFTSRRTEPKITIGCSTNEKGETAVFVTDNGAGFDPNYTHKLFGVFQRLHNLDEFEGNGIGLANVQGIILRHGGRVWAEGAVNKGATFYFSLPRATNGEKEEKHVSLSQLSKPRATLTASVPW
jgi:PAS domain S-box-containing protein